MAWDVFIAHASEDKKEFVEELAKRLTEKGLNVWYDEFTLKMGDSLRRSIDKGLAESNFGIVVLSPDFFSKEWPQKELDGLAARETTDNKVILPIWHKVSKDNILKCSPILADRFAARSEQGMDKVIEHIIKVVKPELIETVPTEKEKHISVETRIDEVTLSEPYEDTSPVTYNNVLKYATQKSKDINWESHIANIYSVYRSLDIHVMAQLHEAIEDKWAREELTKIYQKLLDREPDWVGIFAFQSWIFIFRARGIEIVEQGILASPEYRKKKINFLRNPTEEFNEEKEKNKTRKTIIKKFQLNLDKLTPLLKHTKPCNVYSFYEVFSTAIRDVKANIDLPIIAGLEEKLNFFKKCINLLSDPKEVIVRLSDIIKELEKPMEELNNKVKENRWGTGGLKNRYRTLKDVYVKIADGLNEMQRELGIDRYDYKIFFRNNLEESDE